MKGILFNTQMVQAILAGRKTQTRRVNKDGGEYSMPDMSLFDAQRRTYGVHHYQASGYDFRDKISLVEAPVPICPGDILWVRETWAVYSRNYGEAPRLVYKADMNPPDCVKWRPSIHMPREAARLFLRVTDVRVERLRDIDENGAIAEGFYKGWRLCGMGSQALSARQAFMWFWETMTRKAPAADSWACNPWVWVYTFERITREEAEVALKEVADNGNA